MTTTETKTHRFTVPEGAVGLALVRFRGDEIVTYEPIRYPNGVQQPLRRLAAFGYLAAANGDYQLDFIAEDGETILGEVSLTRAGFDYYRRTTRPRRVWASEVYT